MKFDKKIEQILNEKKNDDTPAFWVDNVVIKDEEAVGKNNVRKLLNLSGPIGMEEWNSGLKDLVRLGYIEIYDKKGNKLEAD
jgi:hypothetical protein